LLSISCISSVSYIKPQPGTPDKQGHKQLYIVRFLHQTTTDDTYGTNSDLLYIVRFLHQTTTSEKTAFAIDRLYIVRFLHQTTTHFMPSK